MQVSIIIPVLNEAGIISQTLQRLTATANDCEIIVADGGSTDGTADIAKRYARVLNAPRGRAAQLNAGAAQAAGDAFIFLHADTILPSGAIEAVKESLSNPLIIGGRFRVRLDHPGWQYKMVGASINLRDRLVKGFTGDQTIFIRANTFRMLGGYPELPLMEDLEFGRRMCSHGVVTRLPMYVTTSARRWQKNGVLRTILLMWALKLLYFCGYPPERLNRLYGDIR